MLLLLLKETELLTHSPCILTPLKGGELMLFHSRFTHAAARRGSASQRAAGSLAGQRHLPSTGHSEASLVHQDRRQRVTVTHLRNVAGAVSQNVV